jgi:oxygen-independent coproporphyrinogen-3 oxidase
MEEYLRGTKPERTPADAAAEPFFLGLRLDKGIDADWSAYQPAVERFIRDGLLETSGNVLRLTRRGVLLSNEVFAEFL